jgi:hypothetical protein
VAAGTVSGSIFGSWLWPLGALLIVVLFYGLGRTIFGTRPSLAATNTVAVALSVVVALGIELLRYGSDKAFGSALALLTPLAALGIYIFILGRYIHRARPTVLRIIASVSVGLFVWMVVALPLMIYIGCRFGECINL